MNATRPLTTEEVETVQAYAARHGRTWKQQLRWAWMDASEPGILQALRNSHGPGWLVRYQLPAVAPAAARADWRAPWEARKAAFVEATWRAMLQAPGQYWAYFTPSDGATWGEFYAVTERVDLPEAAQLVSAEPIPCGARQQIAQWLERHAGRLPMLPTAGDYAWLGRPRPAGSARG